MEEYGKLDAAGGCSKQYLRQRGMPEEMDLHIRNCMAGKINESELAVFWIELDPTQRIRKRKRQL